MRYLGFNNIFIDTHNQLLIRDDETINLAPKVYDLLLFFCQNQQRVLSKDELMDNVWTGTLVTENAISRTLVKVRKALGDDPRNPQFIITVPRKGYRMVAQFSPVEQIELNAQNDRNEQRSENSEQQAEDNLAPNPVSKGSSVSPTLITDKTIEKNIAIKITVMTLMLLLLGLFIYWSTSSQTVISNTKQLKALTREVADELHPSMSPDLSKLAYSKILPEKPGYINIENLTDHSKISIRHPRGTLSRPAWSPTENKLAFLYQHNHVCMIYWAELSDIKNKDTWQTISECSSDSWPHFVFSPDGNSLYFNDRQSKTNGYQVFRVNLANLQKDIVNQPITSGLGNYAFDIAPDGQHLVMLNSEFAPQTRIYTLALADAKLTKTAQLPYLMRSVSWHHDSQTLVHPSPHPAYELWQSNLAGEKLAVVASNTSRVKQVSRINNGQDFTFVSYLLNRDIHFQNRVDNDNKQTIILDNSSVMDYLPALANTRNQYAFVSKRSTTAEVYLAELSDEKTNKTASKRLTFFSDPVKLYQLSFSPDDKQLMILADNQIFIADIAKNVVQQLALENMAINGVSWRDQQTLLFSTIRNNDWYFMQYNLLTKELTKLPVGYQGGVYSQHDQHYYLLSDESGQVMKLADLQQTPQATGLTCQPGFIDRQLNLKLNPDGFVCLSPISDTKKQLLHYSLSDNTISPWQTLPTNVDYQINQNGVIYAAMKQSVADIMRTSSK